MTERTLTIIFMTISRFVFTITVTWNVFFSLTCPNDGKLLRRHSYTMSYDLALIT